MIRKVFRLTQILDEFKPIIPSRLRAFIFKIIMKTKNSFFYNMPFLFSWNNIEFKGRPLDFYGSISDVFLDNDYDFIVPILKHMPSAPVILDAGANVGAFAVFCLSIRDDTIMYSIEPEVDTFRILETNASNFPSWNAYQLALWKEDGSITFQKDTNVSSGSRVGTDGSNNYAVKAMRLHTFIEQHINKPIDILKMDIEGAEEVVLQDSEETLKNVRHLILEIHPHLVNETQIMTLLHKHFSTVNTLKLNETDFALVFASK